VTGNWAIQAIRICEALKRLVRHRGIRDHGLSRCLSGFDGFQAVRDVYLP